MNKKIAVFASLIWISGTFYANLSAAQEVARTPDRWVALSATASAEVPQDWLRLTLSASREGTEPTAVQSQLKQALDAALAVARPQAQPGKLEVRSGAFGVYPRHGRDGKINGWQGQVQLVLEGRDVARLTATAAQVPSLALQDLAFSVSPAARTALEADLQTQAIARFQAKAQAAAQAFGFSRYQLVQVNVGALDGTGTQPRAHLMAAPRAMAAVADSPIPAEPGTATVQLTVNGTVRLE